MDIKRAISSSKIIWLGLILAIGFQSYHRYHFPKLFLDTEVQATGAYYLSQGEGFVQKFVSPTNLSDPLTEPINVFSPYYAQLLSAISLFTKDGIQVIFWIDVLSIILLLVAGHLLFMLAYPGNRGHAWWLFFMAVSLSPFHYLPATDLLCLAIFIWVIYGYVRSFLEKKYEYYSVLVVFALCITTLFRDAYLPFLLLPFGVFVLRKIMGWDKKWTSWSFVGMIVAILWGLGQFSWDASSGNYLKGVGTSRGFYPGNLLTFDSFPIKSLFYISSEYLSILPSWGENMLLFLLYGISLCILFILLSQICFILKKRRPTVQSSHTFVLLLASISGINVGYLLVLSLFTPPETWNVQGFWTYVMETRYFAPTMMGLSLWGFGEGFLKGRVKIAKIFLVSCFLLNLCVFFGVKISMFMDNKPLVSFYESDEQRVLSEIDFLHKESPGMGLVYASFTGSRIGGMKGAFILPYKELTRAQELHAKLPIKLLIYVPKEKMVQEKTWMKNYEIHAIKELNKGNLYVLNIEPTK